MKKLMILILGAACLGSCTKKFEEINVNPIGIAKLTAAEMPLRFTRGQMSAVLNSDDYQVGQSLYADQFAQYWSNSTTYFRTDRFFVNSGWLDQFFVGRFSNAMTPLSDVLNNTDMESPEYALASIMWVYMFHNITDCWGPIPYFGAGKGGNSVAYDSQEKIYDDFFKRLRAANDVLAKNAAAKPFGKNDLIYGGDVAKWKKFSNSLWLRLAMRISDVNPGKAKAEAEAAVAAGVFVQSPDDDALIKRTFEDYDFRNHLSTMSQWGEFTMSAAMESYLKGYKDPRMFEWFSPSKATRNSIVKEYHGTRNGLKAADFASNINKIDNNSIGGFRWNAQFNPNAFGTAQNVMCTAEAYFLRAEGALKGWDMQGNAKNLYDQGITNSFLQWGILENPSAYINGTSLPVAPQDFLNSPAVNNIPVKFSGDVQVQMEQVLTQKWLSTFPDGFVGWSDLRRTGFPKLYPVPNSESNFIPAGSFSKDFKRYPFVNYEYNNNKAGLAIGLQLLGGPDNESTKVWWDKQ